MKSIIFSNLLLAISYLLAQVFLDQGVMKVLNIIGPSVLLATCILGFYISFIRIRFSLLTPMPWFYLAAGVYFGFAPLVYHFGTQDSIDYCNQFYSVNELALIRTNLLNSVGISFVLLGYMLTKLVAHSAGTVENRRNRGVISRRIIFLFILTGLTVKFIFAFPYYMGWISWTLPGSIQILSVLSRVAIVLLMIQINEGTPSLRWLLLVLVAEELVVALMTLSKLAIIEVIIAVGLGWFVTKRPNLKKVMISGASVALLYVFILSPFVTYARIMAGSVGVGSVVEIGESISQYSASTQSDLAEVAQLSSEVQGWWTRLVYTNAQAFAMDDYDHGIGGETISLALHAFIPRLLFPDKVTMTPGRDFTARITGYDTETATAAGVFAEAYWNGGWIMLVFICIFVGALFRIFTLFTERRLALKQFEYIPIMFIGITLGYSICDWFAATYVGPLANALLLYFFIKYIFLPLASGQAINSAYKIRISDSK